MRFDLTDLSLFRHVVEAGSITHGAERAHLALAAASTRIRNMEEALGRAAPGPGAAGRDADPGRPDAAAARPDHAGAGRAAARGPWRLCRRARPARCGCCPTPTRYRIPARGAERVPGRPSARQRRPRRAAERRDRRPDRRGCRRHRHRRRHRGSGPAHHLSVPQRPLRAGGGARSSAGEEDQDQLSPRCWTTISSASTAPARSSDFSAARPPASAARCGCACRCAASTRCAGWPSAMSASASCRPARCGARQRPWRSRRSIWPTPGRCANSPSASATSMRCRRYARQLVEHMRAGRALTVPTGVEPVFRLPCVVLRGAVRHGETPCVFAN